MHMRPSRVLKKLRAGEVAHCVKINLADPRSTEIAAMCGFDCLWLDMEHVPTDWATVENQVRSAKLYDADVLVRVGRGAYNDYIQPLEADATGIMVPHLMSAEDARQVVRQTRFHPLGRRAVDGGNQDGAYCMVDPQEYIRTANAERFVIVQIEDPEPMDELDDIAQIEGIDMIFFGPGDYSHALGVYGKSDPRIDEARKRIAAVARAHGKFAGTVGAPSAIPDLADMGYQFVSTGADVVALWKYFKEVRAEYVKAMGAPKTSDA